MGIAHTFKIIMFAIASGISASSILPLYFVPAVYLLIQRGGKKNKTEKKQKLPKQKHTYQEV
ncbi:MAG: hypothetical protein AAF383_23945 [Cyanobacteria bacterium P01_A01_bin.83]